MKKIPLLISAILLCFTSPLQAVEESSCYSAMEDLRQRQLDRLIRLDEDFRRAAWEYRKYHEAVYTPLWAAALQKNDRYSSKEKRAEGEVAFERIRHLADTAQETARQAFKRIERGLDGLESGLPRDYSCRTSLGDPHKLTSGFRNCMEIFAAETEDRFVQLRALFSKYFGDQESF
jgi:hypothetical protein